MSDVGWFVRIHLDEILFFVNQRISPSVSIFSICNILFSLFFNGVFMTYHSATSLLIHIIDDVSIILVLSISFL